MIITIPIKNQKDIGTPSDSVVVLGYFDGIHKGHQELFRVANKAARKDLLPIVVMTFNESPKIALEPYHSDLFLHILNPAERERKLKREGVEELYLLDFSSRFASLTAEEFFATYIKAMNAKIIVAGFDYTFGSDKKTAEDLKDYFDGEVIIVPPVEDEKGKISSTRIRQAILDGNVKEAGELLGAPLPSRGMVVHGNARGRTIGYPTANLVLLDRTYMPADGVYVVDVEIQRQKYRAMASVGKNVTFDGEEARFEVNIFDFNQDIYGETVMVYWLDRIRDMTKFDSVDQLVDQLKTDEEVARNWS